MADRLKSHSNRLMPTAIAVTSRVRHGSLRSGQLHTNTKAVLP